MASEVKVDKLSQKGSSGIVICDDIKLSSGKAIKNAAGTALLGEDGALGSGVTGIAGSVVKVHGPYTFSDATGHNADGAVSGFSQQITIASASNDVIIVPFFSFRKTAGANTKQVNLFLEGGGLGSGTSGYTIGTGYGYEANISVTWPITPVVLDSAPGSTTPTYGIVAGVSDASTWSFLRPCFTFFEIQG